MAGTYCKISITQRDETGDLVDQCVQIIGHRDGDRLPNALFRLNAATDSVDVSLSNAFGNSTAMIKQLSVAMLVRGDKNRSLVARPFGRSPKSTTAGQHSVGSVGQLAASSVTEERRSGEFAVESEVALGKVGIVVADQSQLAAAVVEMERHFEYYRESARAFADHWFARHRPKRTIAHLIGAGCRGHDTSSTPELP